MREEGRIQKTEYRRQKAEYRTHRSRMREVRRLNPPESPGRVIRPSRTAPKRKSRSSSPLLPSVFRLLPSVFCLLSSAFCLLSSLAAAAAPPPRLAWDPSSSLWLKGYNVYRAAGENGNLEGPINDEIVGDTWYVDDEPTLDPGGTYCYAVTAVDADDRESEKSEKLCIDRFQVDAGQPRVASAGDLVVLAADTGRTDGVAYQWSQLSGPPVTPAAWNHQELAFPAPNVTEPTTLQISSQRNLRPQAGRSNCRSHRQPMNIIEDTSSP